ncbi:ComEC/Rec2 family competence protein [Patescibacteria group bacterium]
MFLNPKVSPARIFLWSLFGVILGVALGPYIYFPNEIITLAVIICLITVWLVPTSYRIIILLILCFGIGGWRYSITNNNTASTAFDSLDKYSEVIGTVVAEEDRRVDHNKLTVTVEEINGQTSRGKILIRGPLYPEVTYGDTIKTSCYIRKPEPIEDFRYDRYLALSGIEALCSSRYINIIEHDQGNIIYSSIYKLKRNIIERINQLLPEPQASFLAGLLVGARRGIPADLQEAFNRTGTTHIIAISGYNITIIATILLAMFKSIIGRKKAFWVIIFALGIFVILTGAQASVMRAAIMGVLVLLARQLGRQSRITNALILAGVLMVMINPLVLRDDKGFQLSFLATLGLVYLSPRIEKYFRWVPANFGLRESVTATLSATVATLPLIVMTFGRLAVVSPLANVLILSVIPITMAIGFMAVIISLIFLPLGYLLAWLAWLFLTYIVIVVKWLSQLSWSAIDIPSLHWLLVLALFILLARLVLPAMDIIRPAKKGFRYEN